MTQTSGVGELTLTLADNIRLTREDRGLSQRGLAEACGIAQGHICHFESGRRMPMLGNLLRLADALDVSTDFLLGRCGPLQPGAKVPKRKKA